VTVAPYPWGRLRRLSRVQARLESIAAVWIAARSVGARPADRLTALVGGPVRAEVVDRSDAFDPHAARCTVRVGGAALEVRGSSLAVRHIVQRVLGGPAELAAPRPLGVVERSIWSLVVATALEDLGVAGEVWPELDEIGGSRDDVGGSADNVRTRAGRGPAASAERADAASTIELSVVLGDIALAVQLVVPSSLVLRVPPARPWPRWFDTTMVDVPIVLGRCALHPDDVARLAVRSLVTLERVAEERGDATSRWRPKTSRVFAELEVFGGTIGLRGLQGALEAEVATGYVARDMALPDDAPVELTVSLGSTRLSLRQVADLAIGQIVELGRPLAGPFELRAEGRVVGRGELVEVDGELAVRIVSLGD
jgi:flagellar motor switch/type III secretory pathway protein FliN